MTIELNSRFHNEFNRLSVQFASVEERYSLSTTYGEERTKLDREKEVIVNAINRILDEYNQENNLSLKNNCRKDLTK